MRDAHARRSRLEPSRRLASDERAVSETIGNVLLIVMTVAMLGAFGTLVISSAMSDTPTPPAATFTMAPKAGESYVLVRHVSGSYLDLAGTHVILQSNTTDVLGDIALVDGTDPNEWAPGETLRIDLQSGTLRPDARLFLMVIDEATGTSIGTAWATVPSDLTGTTILRNALAATLTFDRTQLTADGRTMVNATVDVDSELGILLIDSVLLDLSPVGGDAAVRMYDNGIAPDVVGNDGEFTARFAVANFTFGSLPGSAERTLVATVRDVIGRSATASADLRLVSAPVSKVGMGTEFRDIGSSGIISTAGFLNLTGFTFRDASAVDGDQIEVRVSDLSDPTKAWSALVTFDDDGCPSPSVTSVRLRRDGVAGSVTYTPAGGCFPVDVDSRLNLANVHSSLDANLATSTWTPTGSEATFQYAAAGIGPSNEALIAYFGDVNSTAPLATGLGQADLTWAPPSASATAPAAITTLAGAAGDGYVDLSWSAPANGGSPITGHQIWRDGVLIDTIGANTTYRVAGLVNGQTYSFVVRAVNAVGTAPASNTATATPAALPGVPQASTLQAATGRLYLNWSAPASDGGYPVTSYRIYLNGTLLDTIGTNTSYVALREHNTTYSMQVAAVTSQGEGPKTALASAATPGVPYPPGGLTLTPADGSVTASWTAPVNDGGRSVTGYRIFRNGTLIDTIGTNTSYVLGGLVNGVSYTVSVAAVNEVGAGNAASASATPAPGATVPAAPGSFTVAATNRTAFVNWSAPPDGGSPILNYRVYRNGTLLQEIGTNTTYVAEGLVNGVSYTFSVSAVNAVGEGAATSGVAVTPRAVPHPPSALSVTSTGNRTASLAWTAPADEGGSAITDYHVHNASSGALVASTGGPNTTFTFTGLTNGTSYSFRVVAQNAVGNSSVSNTVSATPTGAPFPPRDLAVSPSNASVALSWTAPIYDSGSAITGFRIVNASNGAVLATTTNPANTSFTVNGLANGHAYTFYVVALNGAGASSGSGFAGATPVSVPFPPFALATTNVSGAVNLSWSSPANTGGSPLTGYNVYRNGTLLASIGTNTTFSDATAAPGVAYTYVVRAVNAIGVSGASNSASGTAQAPPTPPGAPLNLVLTGAHQRVILTWAAPASEGSSPVTGYRIFRSTTNSTGSMALVTTIGTNTSYVDMGRANGTTYYYQVRAVSAAGDGTLTGIKDATPNGFIRVNCASYTITAGNPLTPSCTPLLANDSSTTEFRESGGSNKEFQATFTMNATGLVGAFPLEFRGYRENSDESLSLFALNVTSGNYDLIGTILGTQTTMLTHRSTVYSQHHWPAGILTIRFKDPGPDNGLSSWEIDHVGLVTT